jgi:hypothetical protein
LASPYGLTSPGWDCWDCLGIDMVVLLLATATGVGPLVLLTGGLASVILGPLWWVSVGRLLWREPAL